MVEGVPCLHGIIHVRLVSRKDGFLGFEPYQGGINNGGFCICHELILATYETGIGPIADRC